MIRIKLHYTDESSPNAYKTEELRMPAVPRVGEVINLLDKSTRCCVTRVDHLVMTESQRAVGVDAFTTPV